MSDLPEAEYPGYQKSSPLSSPVVRWTIVGIFFIVVLGGVVWFFFRQTEKVAEPTGDANITQQPPATVPGAVVDSDKDLDGLNDAKEVEYGTSDLEFDTDGDGLRDVDEIEVWKTDPTKPDTDGDGFADGFEVFKGYDPNGPGRLKNSVQ